MEAIIIVLFVTDIQHLVIGIFSMMQRLNHSIPHRLLLSVSVAK